MSPITHDSYEWRELQKKLDAIVKVQAELDKKLASLETQQDLQHGENKSEIEYANKAFEELDLLINGNGTEDAPGLKSQMVTMIAYGRATAFWGKVVAALLGLILTALATAIALDSTNHHSSLHWLTGERQLPELADRPSDAGLPSTFTGANK